MFLKSNQSELLLKNSVNEVGQEEDQTWLIPSGKTLLTNNAICTPFGVLGSSFFAMVSEERPYASKTSDKELFKQFKMNTMFAMRNKFERYCRKKIASFFYKSKFFSKKFQKPPCQHMLNQYEWELDWSEGTSIQQENTFNDQGNGKLLWSVAIPVSPQKS